MSRVAKSPVAVPTGVDVSLQGTELTVKGAKATLKLSLHENVQLKQEDNQLMVSAVNDDKVNRALAGTMRALLSNMVTGVSQGFEKKLVLNGVGYRAQAKGKTVNLTLGFSHPIEYQLPESVTAETPSQTEILLKSADKQLLGQVAAEIRQFRPPEPYKGKGIRYDDERVYRKEAKKK